MDDDKQVKNTGRPHRWKKGESGNLKGRPRKDICITSKVKELLLKDAGDGKTYADLVAEVIVDGITDSAGNLKHGINVSLVRELLDRVEGKVPQPIAGAVDGVPIKITYVLAEK